MWGTMSNKDADNTTIINAILLLWMLHITFETLTHSWGCNHFSNAPCEYKQSKHSGQSEHFFGIHKS
jgi:hypothetical protein